MGTGLGGISKSVTPTASPRTSLNLLTTFEKLDEYPAQVDSTEMSFLFSKTKPAARQLLLQLMKHLLTKVLKGMKKVLITPRKEPVQL